MHHDDHPIGSLVSRRTAVALLGVAGYTLLTGRRAARAQDLAGCIARPQQTEGPYFVDEGLNRSDIRSDPGAGTIKPGTPLDLTLRVSRLDAGKCAPLAGVVVDLWQCDHLGMYSDVQDPGFNSLGKKFLRGYQVTDARGDARFTTIYPGWYPGRTVHLHFKLRSPPSAARGYAFTSQLYFDDAVTDRVHAREPYVARGARTTRNDGDRIFGRGGAQLLLALAPQGEGLTGTFTVALVTP